MSVLVAVTACTRLQGPHIFHVAGDKYVRAVAKAADAIPLIVPAMPELIDLDELLASVDGLLLTGSPSNLEPHHYGETASSDDSSLRDLPRDAQNLALIRKALEKGVPLLAICRGFQELNVAMGGTLHQRVHELEGFMDHRDDESQPIEVQYAKVHSLLVKPSGVFERLGLGPQIQVNSLHGQGIKELGQGLHIEAVAPDGLIEAVSVVNAKSFAVGVQYHPEWQVVDNPDYLALFQAFGKACQIRHNLRTGNDHEHC